MEKLQQYKEELAGKSAEETLAWCLRKFGTERVLLASSFSAEDQVLTDMVNRIDRGARIFTLDTGRLFQETYDVMQRSQDKYAIRYETCVPESSEVAALLSSEGPNAMYQSLPQRHRCCEIRKIRPLRKILATADAWICGLRRDQGLTRTETELIEWDAAHGIYKLNPLFNWSDGEVWQYIRRRDLPYNALYDRGFRSIGCAPCTRATAPDQDIRAGRWWWEDPEHKECGLHRPAEATANPQGKP